MKITDKIDQIQNETDSWKRTLGFLSQENANLKIRLAELLNTDHSADSFLETAELYQNRFVQKDEIIKLMEKDVFELDKLLLREVYEDGIILKDISFRQTKYRKEIKSLESAFSDLKLQFNIYVSELT